VELELGERKGPDSIEQLTLFFDFDELGVVTKSWRRRCRSNVPSHRCGNNRAIKLFLTLV